MGGGGGSEASFEEATSAGIGVVLVLLHGIGLFLEPLGMLLSRLTGGKQLGTADEDVCHIPNLARVRTYTMVRKMVCCTYNVGGCRKLRHDDAAVGTCLAGLVVDEPCAEALCGR